MVWRPEYPSVRAGDVVGRRAATLAGLTPGDRARVARVAASVAGVDVGGGGPRELACY